MSIGADDLAFAGLVVAFLLAVDMTVVAYLKWKLAQARADLARLEWKLEDVTLQAPFQRNLIQSVVDQVGEQQASIVRASKRIDELEWNIACDVCGCVVCDEMAVVVRVPDGNGENGVKVKTMHYCRKCAPKTAMADGKVKPKGKVKHGH